MSHKPAKGFRIFKNGDADLQLSVDGALLLTIAYTQLADRTLEFPANQRQVFATSGSDLAEWEIAYASYVIT